MSEFSSSVHIYNEDVEVTTETLKSLDFPSIIVGTNAKTTTVLLEHQNVEKLPKSLKYLNYNYAEDHGLFMYFHSKNQQIKN